MFRIIPYTPAHAEAWDHFVAASKNGTFLLSRPYIEYHADRFADHSLIVLRNEQIYALLPATDAGGGVVCSHGGLTYGGLVLSDKATAADVGRGFTAIADHLRADGFKKLIYRPTPWIYHRLPAEEDLYAIVNSCGAQLTAREISTALPLDGKAPRWSELRRRAAKRADKAGVTIETADSFADFWPVLEANLLERHGVRPVHSLSEIELLHSRFPDRIRLFTARLNGAVVAGTVLYVTQCAVHSQYISSSPVGRQCGALDALFRHLLLGSEFAPCRYFDFGKSTEAAGTRLNLGLIAQKEGFGGRGVCYDTYEIPL